MVIFRRQVDLVRRLCTQFSSVLVSGPRAAGKSTVCSLAFPAAKCLLLDSPSIRSFLETDPAGIFSARDQSLPLILDEVQAWPEAFAWAKAEIDRDRSKKGQFLLTGSQVFPLMKGVADSLAGRIALLTLYPLSWQELYRAGLTGYSIEQVAELCVRGGFPELWANRSLERDPWMNAYLDTYLLRDVMAVSGVQEISAFRRYLGALAPRAGSLLNLSEVARDAMIPESTARKWLSILESSYIVRLVQPFSSNLSKRWVKSPKLYFIDTGLLCFLLGIDRAESLKGSALFGHILENLVISETIKRFAEEESRVQLFFMRTRSGEEVDLIIQRGRDLWAFEVKARSKAQSADFATMLKLTAELPHLKARVLLTLAPEPASLPGFAMAHWADVYDIVMSTHDSGPLGAHA